MPISDSYNTELTSATKKVFVPSLGKVIVFLFMSVLILVLFSVRNIWEDIRSNTLINTNSSGLTGFLEFFYEGRVPQIIFWGAVGIGMYIVIWFMWNIVTNLRNDITAGNYVHPRSYKPLKYWQSVLVRKAYFGILIIVLAIYFFVFLKLMSVLSSSSYSNLEDFSLPGSAFVVGISVLLGTFLIYVLTVLSKLTANSWQSIYRDL